eukprot:Lithocolla_globosa_v1_NODE_3957_length_1543_cov_182.641129.p1 type:complete len:299 gc:universal NODE_3957_length_1543_cov_182.641129:552-1448(+)
MILLEFGNVIVRETLQQRFTAEKPESIELKVADFDGVLYHLSTPEAKTTIVCSISWKCFGELKSFGCEEVLNKEYGAYVMSPPEAGYDFSLKFDTTALGGDPAKLAEQASMLKRNALSAPFHKAFDAQQAGNTSDLMAVHYRDDESIFIQAQKDRVTVFFSTLFRDDTDVIIGKVFLQEFVDARKNPANQNSPQVLYYPKDPPTELSSVKNLKSGDNVGYVTFVLFPRHFEKDKREGCISLIQTFRDYLHYHIKCSKAYMHSRMRARVSSLLKVLNRAKPDLPVDRTKTASGKTFKKF